MSDSSHLIYPKIDSPWGPFQTSLNQLNTTLNLQIPQNQHSLVVAPKNTKVTKQQRKKSQSSRTLCIQDRLASEDRNGLKNKWLRPSHRNRNQKIYSLQSTILPVLAPSRVKSKWAEKCLIPPLTPREIMKLRAWPWQKQEGSRRWYPSSPKDSTSWISIDKVNIPSSPKIPRLLRRFTTHRSAFWTSPT